MRKPKPKPKGKPPLRILVPKAILVEMGLHAAAILRMSGDVLRPAAKKGGAK